MYGGGGYIQQQGPTVAYESFGFSRKFEYPTAQQLFPECACESCRRIVGFSNYQWPTPPQPEMQPTQGVNRFAEAWQSPQRPAESTQFFVKPPPPPPPRVVLPRTRGPVRAPAPPLPEPVPEAPLVAAPAAATGTLTRMDTVTRQRVVRALRRALSDIITRILDRLDVFDVVSPAPPPQVLPPPPQIPGVPVQYQPQARPQVGSARRALPQSAKEWLACATGIDELLSPPSMSTTLTSGGSSMEPSTGAICPLPSVSSHRSSRGTLFLNDPSLLANDPLAPSSPQCPDT